MTGRISDAEFSVMELVWANGGTIEAKNVARTLHNNLVLSQTTVYTMINRLIAKNVLVRKDPGFILVANIPADKVVREETDKLVDRFYNGSVYDLILDCLKQNRLSENDKLRLKRIVKDL